MESPSQAVILADEVGLSRTIDAGRVLAQWRAGRRRHLLLILSAPPRILWQRDLLNEVGIPTGEEASASSGVTTLK